MKKISIVIIFLTLIISLGFWGYHKYIDGWLVFYSNTDTPKEFKNNTVIKKEDYTKDSTKVFQLLQFMLYNHQQTFYIKNYFDSTQLIIDTILYSPDFNKIAILTITKNPTNRLLVPDKKYDWYFDGYCYVGIRGKDTFDLNSIPGGYRIFYDKEELINILDEFYFRKFASLDNKDGTNKYKYNIDDIRFWDGPIWKEIDDEKIKRKLFDEEKKNHPQNVYEPKQ